MAKLVLDIIDYVTYNINRKQDRHTKENTMKTLNIGGIEMALTPERQQRIVSAIAETQRQIDREMAYDAEFRKNDNIEGWNKHIAYLRSMLAEVE